MTYFGALLTSKNKVSAKLRYATFQLIKQCNFMKYIRKNLLTAP